MVSLLQHWGHDVVAVAVVVAVGGSSRCWSQGKCVVVVAAAVVEPNLVIGGTESLGSGITGVEVKDMCSVLVCSF